MGVIGSMRGSRGYFLKLRFGNVLESILGIKEKCGCCIKCFAT